MASRQATDTRLSVAWPDMCSDAEGLDALLAVEGERGRGFVLGLGEHVYHELTVFPQAERLAEARQEGFGAHALAACIGFGGAATELRPTVDLPRQERLETDAEPEFPGGAAGVVGHEPDHALRAGIA